MRTCKSYVCITVALALMGNCDSALAVLPSNELLDAPPETVADFGALHDWILKESKKGNLPRTSANVEAAAARGKPFIGLALSGGGSRAANFAAAVLLELEKLGLTDDISAISSVSGGSLVGAYYALFGNDKKAWNEKNLRRLLIENFETTTFGTLINQGGNRADVLAEVFDHSLFRGRRFRDLNRPLFINATIDASPTYMVQSFTFRDDNLWHHRSRLDTYPVARAVASSAAFPGVISSMSLASYQFGADQVVYVHLFDGGVADNLGISTLVQVYDEIARQDLLTGSPRPCLMIIVDAENGDVQGARKDFAATSDSASGFVVDNNLFRAIDALYDRAQKPLRKSFGVDEPTRNSLSRFQSPQLIERLGAKAPFCSVWHIGLGRAALLALYRLAPEGSPLSKGYEALGQISTRFYLGGPPKFSSQGIQDLLFDAARLVVYDDPQRPLLYVCDWLLRTGKPSKQCGGLLQGESRRKIAHKVGLLPASYGGSPLPGLLDLDKEKLPNYWRQFVSSGSTAFSPETLFFDERNGSSIRLTKIKVTPCVAYVRDKPCERQVVDAALNNSVNGSKIGTPFLFDKIKEEDARTVALAQELVDNLLRWGVPDIQQSLLQECIAAGARDAYAVLLKDPRDAVVFEKQNLSTGIAFRGRYKASSGGGCADDLTGEVWITPPRDLGQGAWEFIFGGLVASTEKLQGAESDFLKGFMQAQREWSH